MQIAEYIARQRRDGKRFGRFVSIVGTIGFIPVAIMASQLPQGRVFLILLAVILPTMVVHTFQATPVGPRCSTMAGPGTGEMLWIVYTYRYIHFMWRSEMTIARVFKSGNSQAVRLPKKFRLRGTEVEIFRRGDEIVLKERAKGMASAFHLLAGLPDEVLQDPRHDDPPQKRKGL
jgi:antitoxin VapB